MELIQSVVLYSSDCVTLVYIVSCLTLINTPQTCNLMLFNDDIFEWNSEDMYLSFVMPGSGSWVWRLSPTPGSLMRLEMWPPTACMIWPWAQQTTKRCVSSDTRSVSLISACSMWLSELVRARCVPPAVRTSTTVQDIWDVLSFLCLSTTRCFLT